MYIWYAQSLVYMWDAYSCNFFVKYCMTGNFSCCLMGRHVGIIFVASCYGWLKWKYDVNVIYLFTVYKDKNICETAYISKALAAKTHSIIYQLVVGWARRGAPFCQSVRWTFKNYKILFKIAIMYGKDLILNRVIPAVYFL